MARSSDRGNDASQRRSIHLPEHERGWDTTASRSARDKAASEAGALAKVKIDLGDEQFVYRISCSECVVRAGRNWSAYRPGGDNGFMAAMDRWMFHLNDKHPAANAPCITFLSAAEQRLHQRREQQEVDPTVPRGGQISAVVDRTKAKRARRDAARPSASTTRSGAMWPSLRGGCAGAQPRRYRL